MSEESESGFMQEILNLRIILIRTEAQIQQIKITDLSSPKIFELRQQADDLQKEIEVINRVYCRVESNEVPNFLCDSFQGLSKREIKHHSISIIGLQAEIQVLELTAPDSPQIDLLLKCIEEKYRKIEQLKVRLLKVE
jgi:hypothetical protein